MKPPYEVPKMRDVKKVRGTNGFKLVSTFSGCGGSCLGFELAGFEVAWASEFIPAAITTYKANHAGVPVDGRDVRSIKPEEILEATGMDRGEVDVLEGSPPCASFSTAGNRSRDWGKEKKYSDTTSRVDDLFFEYARLLRGIQPKVFVAENVAGLVKGVARGYFKMILRELKSCGYWVAARVVDAQWLGVPQQRSRLIFVGVRSDIGRPPMHPKPLTYRYTLRDALGDDLRIDPVERETNMEHYGVGKMWHTLQPGEQHTKRFNLYRTHPDKPIRPIMAMDGQPGAASLMHPYECRKFSIAELRRLGSFPADFKLFGKYNQKYERIGRAVPPLMMKRIAEVVRDELLT